MVWLRSVSSTEAVSPAWRSTAFMRAIRWYREGANKLISEAISLKQLLKDRRAVL